LDRERFARKIGVVTGAGSESGIGFAAARNLGLSGCRVALTSTTERIHQRVSELKALGVDAHGFVADLRDRKQSDAMCAEILSRLGDVDILVNNAGMVQVGQKQRDELPLVSLSEDAWHECIHRNLTTCFNVTQGFLPGMIERQYGRIVNVSSVTGPLVSSPALAGYSAAKAAMLGMSRSLAIEVGQQGITVNCVAPGWIATGSQPPEEAIGGFNTPMRRSGTPDEVADLIAFLASDESRYITGQLVVIDGGNTLQEYKGPIESYY
jgi:3-oxoacyl-[acyl-carrier protein] reductase